MMLGLGLGMSMLRRRAPAWTPADLPAGVLLAWLEGELGDLGPTDAGAAALADAGASDASTVGFWLDRSPGAKSVKQATAGARPYAGYSAKGKGVAIHGDGAARYLAAASSIAGARHVFADVAFRGNNATRGIGDEPDNFVADYQAYVAGDAVVNPSSVLLLGDTGTNNISALIAGNYYKNGVLTSPKNVGRQRVWQVARFSRTSADMDTGKLRVLTYPSGLLWAQGALRRVIVLHNSASADDIANVQAYMDRKFAGTPVVACTLDSLSACLDLPQNEAWPHLLWRNRWRGCVSVPNFGIPGRLILTAVADDPAKLAAVKGTGKNVVVLQGGANDILAGASASTVWSRLQTYITDAVTAGWQVVVCSIADGTGYSAGQRTEISTLRGLIAAGYAGAGASGYVDLFAAAPALRADGIHYSTAGAITVASAVGAVVDALL